MTNIFSFTGPTQLGWPANKNGISRWLSRSYLYALLLGSLLLNAHLSLAQTAAGWARAMGGSIVGNAVAVDGAGNVYTTGRFLDAVDFDPGPCVFNLSSAGSGDIFVTKFDARGNFLWAKRMGGTGDDRGLSIAVDASGNVYTTGDFRDTGDFDPGANAVNLISAGSNDVFISKLDTDGNFVWVKQLGGTSAGDTGRGITLDGSGNFYTVGDFGRTVDFDPGVGVTELTSAGDFDIFVAKFNASGNFVWAKSMGGTGGDQGSSIAVDASGNVYTTGNFSDTGDFDPGAGETNLTSVGQHDIFVSKLNASGNLVWAKAMGGTSFDYGESIAVDASGNVYTTGYFYGTVDFDPGAGETNLTSAGETDVFVSKLDASGNLVWVKHIGSTNLDTSFDITVDGSGNVYPTGYFNDTVDFDPGAGEINLTSAGGNDAFVARFNPDGNLAWAIQMGGTENENSWGIAASASNLYVTGQFRGTADFDPGAGVVNLSGTGSGGAIFVVGGLLASDGSLPADNPCPSGGPTVSISPPSATVALGGSVTLTASGGANCYNWSNGSRDNPLILSNLISSTVLSVTGSTGFCSTTASVPLTVTSSFNTCTSAPAPITVSGYTNTAANGVYTPNGFRNGVPSWSYNWFNLYWTGDQWELNDFNGFLSINTTGSATLLPCSDWQNQSVTDNPVFSGGCGPIAVPIFLSITATPSATITTGIGAPPNNITLTASGADSFTWSNGEEGTSIVLTNVTSASTVSVTGVSGACSNTASTVVEQASCQPGIYWLNRTAPDASWRAVTYGTPGGNPLFVAVAYAGGPGAQDVMTSPDGINWTIRTAIDNSWRSVTYGTPGGNPLFVAVGSDGDNRVMTSPDGINWTARTAAERNTWRSVTYGNGVFVAVSENGTNRVMTSPDGITWTPRTVPQNRWLAITYGTPGGNPLFVVTAERSRVMTSPDGINWTPQTATEDNDWVAVTYGTVGGNGLFVAVSRNNTNRVMTSPDGITWTPRTAAQQNEWRSVTYGNGLFVAVADNSSSPGSLDRVMTSPDGITWTRRAVPTTSNWWAVTYGTVAGNGLFVATASSGFVRAMVSSCEVLACPVSSVSIAVTPAQPIPWGDSVTLTASGATSYTWSNGATENPLVLTNMTSSTTLSVTGVSEGTLESCSATATVSVSVGQPGETCNGALWTAQTAPGDSWQAVTYGAAGGSPLFVAVSGYGTNPVITSPDGLTWTARTAPNAGWKSVTYGKGLFVAVAEYGDRVMTSPDGLTWTTRTAEQNTWKSVTYGTPGGNPLFVAVSSDGTNQVMTSPDGLTWTPQAAPSAGWLSVTYGNGRFVAVNQFDENKVMTSTDGINWTTPTGVPEVYCNSVTYGTVGGSPLFVAVAEFGTNQVMTSPDGINWTARRVIESSWQAVTYGTGLFVAVASYGDNRVMTSPDGINWTARTAAEENSWQAVAFGTPASGNRQFVAVTNYGTNYVMSSSCSCVPPSISIMATPSLTVGLGGSVTLTASAGSGQPATTYLWSNGVESNSLVLTNVSSTTSVSVIGTGNDCSVSVSATVVVAPFCNTVVHVTPTGDGTADGSSWANALPGTALASALISACSGTTFLVGAGLYKPTTDPTDRTASFTVASGVEVYGGYTVVGGAATGRVISTSTGTPSSTTFSGDIDDNNTLDAGNSYNVVSMSNVSASTRLDGVVITGGYANVVSGSPPANYYSGGGVYNVASGLGNSSNPTITNCHFEANFAPGGILYNGANEGTTASPTISNCRFVNNSGVGLYVETAATQANRANANPTVTNTVFTQNTAQKGGAFRGEGDFGDISPIFTNCQFIKNTATDYGGAMYWFAQASTVSVTAINCTFTDNTSAKDGGAVYVDGCCGLDYNDGFANIAISNFQGCTFTGNATPRDGGALYVEGGYQGNAATTLTNCIFSSNSANVGGAIYVNTIDSGTAAMGITGSTFTDNRSQGDGGAIYSLSAVAGVQSSTFTGNSAGANGGAIYDSGSSLTLTGSLMSQNTANVGSGGGLYATSSSTLTIANTDVLANQASSQGGGIFGNNNTWLRITGGRVSQNTSNQHGGGLYADEQATLTGVLISQNTVSGSSGGGGFASTQTLNANIQSCTFVQNTNSDAGAGIVSEGSNSTFVIGSTLFDRNTSSSSSDLRGGGGFGASGSGLLVQFSSCTFTGNTANIGGGIGVPSGSTLVVANSAFTGNVATATGSTQGGGGIFAYTASLTITGTQFAQNTALSTASNAGGGAVFANATEGGPVTIAGCSFSANQGANGGAYFNQGTNFALSNSLFSQNKATASSSQEFDKAGGGAVFVNGTNNQVASVQSSTFSQNQSAGQAGAWSNYYGRGVEFRDCLFSQNQAASFGGGISSGNGMSLTLTGVSFTQNTAGIGGAAALYSSAFQLTNTRFVNNTARGDAGALYASSGSNGSQVNSLFSRNTAGGQAGVLYTTNGSPQRLVNATMYGNTATGGGTVFVGTNGSSIQVQNSIIWGNGSAPDNFSILANTGGSLSLQNSLVDPTSTTYTDGGNNKAADPLFTNEATNDLTLTGCSPAVDAGDNTLYTAAGGPATDLADLTRPFNTTVDMGAYEFQGTPGVLSVSITATPSLTITYGGSVTLTASGASSYTWSDGSITNPLVLNNVTSATTLSVTATAGTCSGTASAAVSVSAPVTLVISPTPASVCAGSSTTLSVTATGGTQPYTYNWQVPAGFTLSSPADQSVVTATASASGTAGAPVQTFTLTVSSANGGPISTSTVAVTVSAIPSVSITTTPTGPAVCAGTSVTLTAPSGLSYSWSNGAVSQSINFVPTSTTVLSLTATNGFCAAPPASATITVQQAVTATITPNPGLTICTNAGGLLTATGAGVGGSYVWNTNATTAAITVNSSGPYSVTAINSAGCSSTATVTVTALNPAPLAQPVLSASSSAVCEGGSVSVTATVTGSVDSYQWYQNGVSLGSAQSSSVLTLNGVQSAQAGSYVLVIEADGCASATSTAVTITVNPLPTVTITFPTSASVNPAGPVITVPVGQGLSYQVFGGGSNGRYERKIVLDRIGGYEIRTTMENSTGIFPIDKAGPYTITVTDGNGCSRTVTGEIRGQ